MNWERRETGERAKFRKNTKKMKSKVSNFVSVRDQHFEEYKITPFGPIYIAGFFNTKNYLGTCIDVLFVLIEIHFLMVYLSFESNWPFSWIDTTPACVWLATCAYTPDDDKIYKYAWNRGIRCDRSKFWQKIIHIIIFTMYVYDGETCSLMIDKHKDHSFTRLGWLVFWLLKKLQWLYCMF